MISQKKEKLKIERDQDVEKVEKFIEVMQKE